MNLSKIEKIIILVLVIGIILALGIIFLCKPAFESIEKADKNLVKAQEEYDELNSKLERLNTIDADIKAAKDTIGELEDCFYPDLTTYEAVEILLAHIGQYDFKTLTVTATQLSTEDLSLEYYVAEPVLYDLKTYSENAKEIDENEIVLVKGQFLDNNKVYTVTASDIDDVKITDENEEVVEVSKYTDTMIDAHKEAVCRYAFENKLQQTVSVTNVTFDVAGEYGDYLELIDYLSNFERATYLTGVEIPVTFTVNRDSDGKYYRDGEGFEDQEIKLEGNPTAEELAVDFEDSDIIEPITLTVSFFGVEQVEEIENLEINGVKIVTNQ